MSCGGEEKVAARREKKKSIEVTDEEQGFNYDFSIPLETVVKNSPTFFRTTPFPEQEWPHDPLSDFSSVFVISGRDETGNSSFDSLISASAVARRGFRLWSWMISQPEKPGYLPIEGYSLISPEKVTTNFTSLVGLRTRKIPFGWHFLLRQEMYMKVKRNTPKIEKRLRILFKKVFRTDDPDSVACPPLL